MWIQKWQDRWKTQVKVSSCIMGITKPQVRVKMWLESIALLIWKSKSESLRYWLVYHVWIAVIIWRLSEREGVLNEKEIECER